MKKSEKKNLLIFDIILAIILSWVIVYTVAWISYYIFGGFNSELTVFANPQGVMATFNSVNVVFGILTVALVYYLPKKFKFFIRLKRVGKIMLIPLIIGTLANIAIQGVLLTDPRTKSKTCSEQLTLMNAKKNTFIVSRDDGGHGTAFAIDNNGKLLTNNHVIDGSDVKVWFDDEWRDAAIQKTFEDEDLAVIKIEKKTTAIELVGTDSLNIAETLYAIGWPIEGHGDSTVTKGIFSRLVDYEGLELIQTDTAINPGNSGGPLMSRCGVVGINTSKETWVMEGDFPYSVEGQGYAISSDSIKKIINYTES